MTKRSIAFVFAAVAVLIALVAAGQGWAEGKGEDVTSIVSGGPALNVAPAAGEAPEVTGDIVDALQSMELTIQQSEEQCLQQCDSHPGNADRRGCRLKCKNAKLVDEICVQEALGAHDSQGILTAAQQQEATNFCDQATQWADITTDEDYKTVGRARVPECVVMEYDTPEEEDDDCDFDGDGEDDCEKVGNLEYYDDGNQDGVCDLKGSGQGKGPAKYDEWCREDDNDGIGDDDGFCETVGQGSKAFYEPCLTVCDQELVEGQEGNYQAGKFDAVEGLFDDISADVMAANAAVAQRMQVLTEVRATSAQLQDELQSGEPQELCLNMMDADVGGNTYTEREPYWAANLTMTAFTVADAGYNICSAPSDSVILGNGNYNVVCLGFAIGQGVTQLAWLQTELFDDTISAERIDNAAMCLEYLGVAVDKLKKGVDEANAKLDQVLVLLNMPPGQRSDFPITECDNDGKCDQHENAPSCPGDCAAECGDGFVTHAEECESYLHCSGDDTCSGCVCVAATPTPALTPTAARGH